MRSALLGLVLLPVVLCGNAFGNTGVFAGSGHTLQLVKSADVRMVSEDITITPVCGASAMQHSVDFRCTFVLKNLSAKPLKIQVGFPLDRGSNGPPRPPSDDTNEVLSYHFIARDANNTYHVRYAAGDPQGKYEHIFLWDMEFAATETKTLQVGYILPMSVAAYTTRKVADPEKILDPPQYEKPWHARIAACEIVFFSYITETGQSWARPIEKATFRFRNNGFEHSLRKFPEYMGGNPADLPPGLKIPDEDPSTTIPGSMADLGFVFGMKLGTVYPRISPAGWKPTYIPEIPPGGPKPQYEPDSIIWKFENYKPGPPLNFTYYLLGFPETASDCDSWVRRVLGKTPTKADVLELREIVAAFFGIAPQTASVKRFVEQQIWWNPQSKVNESELSEPNRDVLARIKAIADENKNVSGNSIQADFPPIAQEPKLRGALKGHIYQVTAVAFSPDGKTLASGSCDATIKLWDVATAKNITTLGDNNAVARSVAYSPDGNTLASGGYGNTVKLWDVATGKDIATFNGHTDVVFSVAFSPDGRTLASASGDMTVKVWDVATAKNIATLRDTHCVLSVTFSPDGKTLASGSQGETIKLWDSVTGKQSATLGRHIFGVDSVAFSPDSKTLASSGDLGNLHNNTVKLWDVSAGSAKENSGDRIR